MDKTLSFDGSTEDLARSILDTLEGAMLVARPYGDRARFDSTARLLIDFFANRTSAFVRRGLVKTTRRLRQTEVAIIHTTLLKPSVNVYLPPRRKDRRQRPYDSAPTASKITS